MKKILNFFISRSILFYIFWSSLLIGEGVHLIILHKCSGTLLRFENIFTSYLSQIIHCDPIKIPFVEICQSIYLYSFIAYLFWYSFKFLRFLFRLGYK